MSFSRSAIAANAQKACSEPRCPNKRQNGTLTRRCRFHNNARRNHQIRPSLLRPFRKVAARFIKAHQNDEQMILALATLRELLEPGEEPQSRVSRRWHRPEDAGKRGNWNPDYLVWKRLVLLQRPLLEPVHGGCKPGQPREYRRRPPIEPEEVLREILTVFLLTENYPDFLKDDGKPLSVEVARRVFKLRPSGKSNTNSKTPAYSACVAFGERLRNSPLWIFMMRNLETIKLEDAARKQAKATLYTPMEPRLPTTTKKRKVMSTETNAQVYRQLEAQKERPRPETQNFTPRYTIVPTAEKPYPDAEPTEKDIADSLDPKSKYFGMDPKQIAGRRQRIGRS